MLYLHLFHGRNTTDEQLDDWGFDGPTIGPIESVQQTYGTLRLIAEDADDIHIPYKEALVEYDGKFYGDFTVSENAEGTPVALSDTAWAKAERALVEAALARYKED